MSTADTTLTAANKASERALVNMVVKVSDSDECSKGCAEELVLSRRGRLKVGRRDKFLDVDCG